MLQYAQKCLATLNNVLKYLKLLNYMKRVKRRAEENRFLELPWAEALQLKSIKTSEGDLSFFIIYDMCSIQ